MPAVLLRAAENQLRAPAVLLRAAGNQLRALAVLLRAAGNQLRAPAVLLRAAGNQLRALAVLLRATENQLRALTVLLLAAENQLRGQLSGVRFRNFQKISAIERQSFRLIMDFSLITGMNFLTVRPAPSRGPGRSMSYHIVSIDSPASAGGPGAP